MSGTQQWPLDISSGAQAVMSMYLGGSMETRVSQEMLLEAVESIICQLKNGRVNLFIFNTQS